MQSIFPVGQRRTARLAFETIKLAARVADLPIRPAAAARVLSRIRRAV